MSKVLVAFGLVILVVLCALALPQLNTWSSGLTGSPQGEPTVISVADMTPQTSGSGGLVGPTEEAPPAGGDDSAPMGPAMLVLDMPEQLQAGTVRDVAVLLMSTESVQELSFELVLPQPYLQVEDDEPALPGIQVTPRLPMGAFVDQREVGEDGVLRYRVRDLGTDEVALREILTMRVRATSPSDFLTLEFKQVVLLGPGGAPLEVNAPPVLVEIVEGAVSDPEGGEDAPTPTSIPPTPTSIPPTETPVPHQDSPPPTPVPPTPTAPPPTPVPPTPTAAPPPTGPAAIAPGVYYRIQPGQTLYQLAQNFDTTPQEIAAANGIADVTAISVGTLLRIPVMPPAGQAAYLVSPRETLFSIANAFDLTVEALAAQNGLAQPYTLEAGRWLVLRP